ncbi:MULTISPECIES: DUF4142 domain-containing protein [unclassified Roseateles]|uniref:DUF4142 domain-containing protein n=1 Tax=unclassified Roseateles TaxID=2626991 RepID=UPI0006F2AF0E|nr:MULTISPECIES: DUF4142 domain-containing protein [unclassified Roseateles]KQW50792.1 hypothetical protein ASC81_24155 [Pelomonas sp. Root405]KRA70849.1 hypothetical protein ASD88_13460 [Pelomonas sp. Root662]
MKRLPSKLLVSSALTTALVGLWAPLQAQAQTPAAAGSAPAAAGKAVPAADRNFAVKAAVGGLAEVQLGELAQRQGASNQVKQFGAQMVKDHGQANQELKSIAAAKGLDLPTQLDAEHRNLAEKLQRASGEQFDRLYVQAMLDAHRKDVALFEKQAGSGQDAELKAFAAKTLPTLRQHLTHVQGLGAPARAGTPGQP